MAEEATQDKNEEEKDSELDMLAEQELIRLTRQFRVKKVLICVAQIFFLTNRLHKKCSNWAILSKLHKYSKVPNKTGENLILILFSFMYINFQEKNPS